MRGWYIVIVGLVLGACGQSDSKSSGDDSGDSVGVTGQILLEDFSAELRPDSLLVMKTLGGSLDNSDADTATTQLQLGDDGSFSTSLSSEDQTLAILKAAIKDDGTVDRESLKDVLGANASQIDDVEDKELIAELESMIEASEKQGGPIYLLIGAALGGSASLALSLEDRASIAETFRFVGLPSETGNFIGIPAQSAKADLRLGEVSKDDGDEAASELTVSTDVFELSQDALAQLNSIDDVLKGVKNAYINTDWQATPFFLWQNNSAGKSTIDNKFSKPTASELNGFGFYAGGSNIPFTFSDVCKADESARKTVQLVPPTELTVEAGDSDIVVSPESPFDNSGEQMFGSQDGNDNCSGGSFYARDDGAKEIMLNFGTGGGIKPEGGIPSGQWTLKYEGGTLGIFDLGTSSPVDADGKPNVFIPAVKATTDANGFITKMSVQFYFWDKSAKKFVQMIDVTTIDKIVTEIEAEITRDDTTGADDDATEERVSFKYVSDGLYETPALEHKFKLTGTSGDPEPVARDASMYYVIGDNTYRFEFRE